MKRSLTSTHVFVLVLGVAHSWFASPRQWDLSTADLSSESSLHRAEIGAYGQVLHRL
jgi:hypothetical protein